MTSHILITGATGNVGLEIIRQFPSTASLRAAILNPNTDPTTLAAAAGEPVETVEFDFTNPATYPAAFAGIDVLFLVRPPHLSNVVRDIAPAIDAAVAAGVYHIVFLSIVGVENNKVVPHYKIEQHVLSTGVGHTFLRASFFMQNLNTTHRAEIRDQNVIAVPVGRARTSFIDVRDIAAIAVRALLSPTEFVGEFNLTGGEALDYYQIAAILSDVLGQTIRYSDPAIPRFVAQQLRAGRTLPMTLVMTALYTITRRGSAAVVNPDMPRLLGRPPIPFVQYARDHRAAWT